MLDTEAQKDKYSAIDEPETPAGKLRGQVGYLQVSMQPTRQGEQGNKVWRRATK